MKSLCILSLVLLASCGFQKGVCEIDGGCTGSQKNTCESNGGKWSPHKEANGFDPDQVTCGDLGYAKGRSPNFTK